MRDGELMVDEVLLNGGEFGNFLFLEYVSTAYERHELEPFLTDMIHSSVSLQHFVE